MSGEDQERFEDYLELEHYIEELQAGRVAHPPEELTPGQASIYRMAALFRSSSPEASEPRPEFAAELRARLEQELQQPPQATPPFLQGKKSQTSGGQRESRKSGGISRRALLTGGAAIAASLVVGAGTGAAIEHSRNPGVGSSNNQTDPFWGRSLGDNVPTTWHFVTTLASLGDNAVRFAADTVVGYVIRNDGDDGDPDKGKIIAISAACTHMGCIVQWQDSDRKFHCPCHGGLFTEYGKVDAGAASLRYLRALPRLNTKVENGNVYVEVPASQK
jgi:nitrite reductase/ring-hydroxylating ferredoxin subunit